MQRRTIQINLEEFKTREQQLLNELDEVRSNLSRTREFSDHDSDFK